jgi:hypothetical protein
MKWNQITNQYEITRQELQRRRIYRAGYFEELNLFRTPNGTTFANAAQAVLIYEVDPEHVQPLACSRTPNSAEWEARQSG